MRRPTENALNLTEMQVEGPLGKSLTFAYRPESKGDNGVVQQIFQHKAYELTRWKQGKRLMEWYHAQPEDAQFLVVDAGANIGASAAYFLNRFPRSFVFAIEPELHNWELLERNTAAYQAHLNFRGGIASQDGELVVSNPGAPDWAFRTAPAGGASASLQRVPSICPRSILAHPACAGMVPLIFKVDIEGAEADLFQGDVSWMDQFPVLIIELHDWMLPFTGSSRAFFQALASLDFDFLHRGENVFLFNRRILGQAQAESTAAAGG